MTPPDWFIGRRFGLGVAAVVAAAVGLRAFGLGAWPFGSDELGTFDDVRIFYHPPVPVTHPDQLVPRVIPLSMVVLDLGHRMFGRDEWGCRVLVAILGVAHVALVTVGLRGLLGPAVAVGVGGVDQVPAGLDETVEDAVRLVHRRVAAHEHGPETEAADGQRAELGGLHGG